MVREREFGYRFDEAIRRHAEEREWDLDDDDIFESESPWERGFEIGEELALEEQTFGAEWDED